MNDASISLEATWRILQVGISEVMDPFETNLSYAKYMDLYTLVYNFCTKSTARQSRSGANLMGGELYYAVKDFFITHLHHTLEQYNDTENILQFYSKHWTRYTMGSTLVHHIFKYLNRHWIKRETDEGRKHIFDIYTLSLVSWKDHLFLKHEKNVLSQLLKQIEKERNGDTIDNFSIKGIIDSYVSLGLDENDSSRSTLDVYKKYFEEPFIAQTMLYYTEESTQCLLNAPVTEYLKKAEARLSEETNRVNLYLHPSTHDILIKACDTVFIVNNSAVIQDEFNSLLDQDRIADLARMFRILTRVPETLEKLRGTYEGYVKQQGLAAIEKVLSIESEAVDEEGEDTKKPKSKSNDADPKTYVDALLSVHKKYNDIVQTAFSGEAGFVAALDKACREITNRNSICKVTTTKSPELLAKYCDSLLKKGTKIAQDNEIEKILGEVMIVFKYVEDKDVFQKFYSKMLCRRLVNDTSVSEDSEAFMIAKLKEVCGFEYTSKLQRMFTDMEISKNLDKSFKEQMERNHSNDEHLDFGILVLSTASWPLNAPTTEFTLPQEFQTTYERFQLFYQNKHTGRKLTWLFQQCKGELKTQYLKTVYTFQVSAYQMGILLQYNTEERYTFEQLQANTRLEPETLQGNLSLFLKAKILLFDEKEYTLNTDFKSKKIRINLNMPIRSEQKQETEETHKNVENDRNMLIQSAIVRVMKARKVLKHVELMDEVINIVKARFKPQIADIKKCIDMLMEKEYIERKEGERDTYNYLA